MNSFNPDPSTTRAALVASTPVSRLDCPAARSRQSELWRRLRLLFEPRSVKKAISCQFACVGLILWAATPPASAQSLEVEYNDVPTEATPLVLMPVPVTPGAPAGTFIAAMRGSIADPSDVDCYSFTAPLGGGTAWLYFRTAGDSVMSLIGPGGATEQVDDNEATANAYNAVVESIAASVMGGVPLAPGATFTIEIRQGPGGLVGDYELFAAIRPTPPPPAPPFPVEVEPNGIPPLALAIPLLDPAFTNEPAFGVVNGMIDVLPPSDVPDLFFVPAMPGDVLQVTLDCNPGGLGSENLSVSLLDEFGILFTAENSGPPFGDLAVPADPSAEGFCWEITIPGPYFLSVAGPLGADYTLAVQRQTRGVLGYTSAAFCVEEGAGVATVTVARTGGSFGTVTVDYATFNETAQAGADYVAVSGTLVFGPGETSQTFTVPILDDAQAEASELAGVYLWNVTGGATLGLSYVQFGILDDDEPDNRSPATAIPLDLTAGIAITNGAISPAGDVDYYRIMNPVISGRLVALVATGGPQSPCATTRTPRLSLYAADGTTLREVDGGDGFDPGGIGPATADSVAIVRTMNSIGVYYLRVEADTPGGIIDPYVLHVALNTNAAGNEIEPNGTFTTPHFIDLGPWPLATVRGFFDSAVDTDTYLLNALAGSELLVGVDGDPERDGVSTDVVVELIAGNQTTVLVRADSSALPTSAANPFLAEAFRWSVPTAAAEAYYLRVTGTPGGAYRLTVAARSAGQIHFDNLMRSPCGPFYYTTESAGPMTVTVQRTYGNFGPASVSVATSDGSAVAGLDYSAVAMTVNFAHGETRRTVTIPILNDTEQERVENLDLLLGNPTGGATAWQFALAACVSGTVSPEGPASRLFIVDTDEPANDFYVNAPPLDASFAVARANGTVSPWTGDMVDWYCITNPEPNSELWVTVDTGGPRPYSPYLSRDSIVAVYRADGSYLATDDDNGSGNGGDSTLESGLASAVAGVRLPAAGNYYVAVFAFDPLLGVMKSEPSDTNALPIVDYRLWLTLTRNAGLPSLQRGNDSANATPIVTACVPAGVRTNSLRYGEERWYSVVASAGDELHVSLDGNISRRPTGCTLADSIVDLIAPDGGTVVFSANSSGCGGSEGFGYVATSSGTFLVRVRLSSRNEGYATPMGFKLMVARQASFSGAVRIAGADVQVSFPTSVGQTYSVQSSEDIVNWTTLPGTITGTGGPAVYVDAGGAGRPARYYRIVASGGGAMGAAAPLCLPPPSGLLAWWAGDANASNLMSGLTGALQGGMGFTNDGYVGGAFHFDGVNDFVRLGDLFNPGSASFTVNTWFRRTGTEADFRLISKSRSEGYWLGGDGRDITFEVNAGRRVRATAPLPALNEWHHVAGVLDRAGSEVRLYLDGTLYARQGFPTLGEVTTENYLSLGARDRGPGPGSADNFFPGQMDEAQYFNRALTECEIGAIFNAGRAGQCQP